MNSNNINRLPSLPDWVTKLLVGFGGLRKLDTVDTEDIGLQNTVDCLVVYENEYLQHRELLINALQKKKINTLIIFNTHVFLFDENILHEINDLSKHLDIHMICQGYFAKNYDNIKVHHIELEEHFISHHFTLLLATKLQSMKNPKKTFLMQVNNKDHFRKTVLEGVTNSDLKDDVISTNWQGVESTTKLLELHTSLMNHIKEEYKDNPEVFPALDSFGVCPNFSLYEKPFCEIVVETKNTGAWHFTEKTFRPIAFRVPIVYLGSKPMYDILNSYGYNLYDHEFYQYWHDEKIPLYERVERLVSFMQHIKNNEKAKEQMQATADSNFQIFWNQRKLHYYQNWNQIFDQVCEGKNISRVIDSVYSKCNF